MEKFRNKYRIPTNRWQNWDYGSNSAYYITICTKNRIYYFGNVTDKIMQLSESGKIAEDLWLEIPNQFHFVRLDVFIIMPNHIHGIVVIDKSCGDSNVETRFIASHPKQSNTNCSQPIVCSETRSIASLHHETETFRTGGITGNKNPMIWENLSRVIRWYKGRCSFEIRKIESDFTWQSRFHDHVIRDYLEYTAIK